MRALNFDDTIKIKDFNIDALIDEKSYENILVYNFSYKSEIDSKHWRIGFDKIDGFIRVYEKCKKWYYINNFS